MDHIAESKDAANGLKSYVSVFLESIENIAKLAGICAVFGYLSLRSHLNFLGIPFQVSLGLDRYLMESYQFFSAICYSPELLCVLLLGWTCISLARTRHRSPNSRLADLGGNRIEALVHRLIRSIALPLLLIALECWLLIRELQLLTSMGTSVVVGAFKKSSNHSELAALAVRTDGQDLFLLIVLFCAIGLSACFLRSNKAGPFATAFWKAFAFMLVLLGLQLPVLYGVFLRSSAYSLVEVQPKDGPTICGALIIDSGEKLALWRANGGIGWVEELPDKETKIRALGDVDVLSEAGKSFTQKEDVPSCKVVAE